MVDGAMGGSGGRAALNAAFARHVARVLGPPAAWDEGTDGRQPQDFCGSMDRVIPALPALLCAWSAGMVWQGTRYRPMVVVTHYAGGQAHAVVTDPSQPAAWATALVWAAVQLLDDRGAPDSDGAGQEEA